MKDPSQPLFCGTLLVTLAKLYSKWAYRSVWVILRVLTHFGERKRRIWFHIVLLNQYRLSPFDPFRTKQGTNCQAKCWLILKPTTLPCLKLTNLKHFFWNFLTFLILADDLFMKKIRQIFIDFGFLNTRQLEREIQSRQTWRGNLVDTNFRWLLSTLA